MNKRILLSLLLVAGAACTSNPAPGEEGSAPAVGGRAPDIITAAELDDPVIASLSLFNAIERLRPRFLMTRGAVSSKNVTAGSTHVSVDGGPLVGMETLTRLLPAQVGEVRFLSASDAAQRFGTNAASGAVILVKSR